jgi:hypothetical protein
MVAFPYYVLVELLGPVIETLGYVAFAATLLMGWASPAYVGAFVLLAVVLGSLISTLAVVLQEVSFFRYRAARDVAWLLALAIVENLGYRQLTVLWRLRGLVSAARRDTTWGQMTRRGFEPAEADSARDGSDRARAA